MDMDDLIDALAERLDGALLNGHVVQAAVDSEDEEVLIVEVLGEASESVAYALKFSRVEEQS